jgi:hypothetical protein
MRKLLSMLVGLSMVIACGPAFAGGPVPSAGPAPQPCAPPPAPCGPGYAAPGGNPCAFWGDAPFPGLCGGIVALPFLVVGTILGGNPLGPHAPVGVAPCAPPRAAMGPAARYCPPAPYVNGYPPRPTSFLSNGILGTLPPVDLASGLIGNITGGPGLL